MPFGLGDDADAKALRLQHATDDGHAETGVVHIRVAGHQNDVATVPSELRHFSAAHGQKRCCAEASRPILFVTGQRFGGAIEKGDVYRGVH